jgi:hypothetical protein
VPALTTAVAENDSLGKIFGLVFYNPALQILTLSPTSQATENAQEIIQTF